MTRRKAQKDGGASGEKRGAQPPAYTQPPLVPPKGVPAEVLASQRRRLLAKHYINKYRVRRGR